LSTNFRRRSVEQSNGRFAQRAMRRRDLLQAIVASLRPEVM
jgi:hypothetical protein